ncbi:uncharacterized protein LOC119264009 isoform X2 [Pygocentrus nattereri]|uniref:uncharacterized protein LOC119264009 isoform X2 n=1 Tax=Pygocentrus nattereri TaxID=42514 RepID=UPI001891C876|nr:uncharacterized protein LOC119264009 isoform X2 [Pygocentrus nattereri]
MNAFMFDFLWHGKFWTIDAARDDGSLGRLVNDDHINPNCKMKRLIVEGRPHLCLFALRDITPGEEITYNYGDGDCPWRSEVIKSGMEADNNHLESEGASGDDQHCIKPSQHKSAFGVQMKKNAGSNRLESEVASEDDQHRTQHSQLESTFCSEMTKNGMEKDSNRLESEVASRDDQHCTQHSQLESTFLNQMTKNGMEKDSNRLESEVASGDDQHCTQHSQLESTFPNQVTTIVMQEHSHHLESDLTCGDAQQQRSAFLVQILEQNRTYTASSGDLD